MNRSRAGVWRCFWQRIASLTLVIGLALAFAATVRAQQDPDIKFAFISMEQVWTFD